ncbi:MAG TPA: gluconate 2-dehydrogenase subunit 3 family protein [Steroidobacteraceae bacterium]|jgi:hypothetical protein
MSRSRREFVAASAAGGLCLLTFSLAGCDTKLTPAQARAANLPPRTLDTQSLTTLESLAEILVPGAAAAGIAQYLDHQLSGAPADSMLMIKYLNVGMPFVQFYRGGVQAAELAARRQFTRPVAELSPQQSSHLLRQMSAGELEGWQGPPQGLFYFVLRNDAVDVLYGTQSGFELLGVPYMAHIVPPSKWG